MKRFLLAFAVLTTIVFQCMAKPQQRNAVNRYVKDSDWDYWGYSIRGVPGLRDVKSLAIIPPEIRRIIQSDMHTCYFGTLQMEPKASPLFVHIYYRPEKAGSAFRRCQIDLYERRSIARQKGKQKLFRINQFILPVLSRYETPNDDDRQSEFLYTSKYLDVQYFWLDPTKKTIPALKIDSYNDGWGDGYVCIIKFTQGWRYKPYVDQYCFGYAVSSSTFGMACIYGGIGEDGRLIFYQADLPIPESSI